MRQIKYLSPSSIAVYVQDKTQFYLQYLADERPERFPQTDPMAVGSAFDAFVKSYLHKALFGLDKDPKFDRIALFEAQVELQNRDKAYKAGEYCFEEYKKTGCLADLMLELTQSVGDPKFEFDIMGQVEGKKQGIEAQFGVIPFLGKPDVFYINQAGARVIVDWKVNGYYSSRTITPMKGYVRLRDKDQNYGSHKEAMIGSWKGMRINISHYLDQIDSNWARQLAIYSWLLGCDVGTEECIAGIDQIVCTPDTVRNVPKIRVAEHRLRIGKEFQYNVFALASEIWDCCTNGHYFKDLDVEASKLRCQLLDTMISKLNKEVPATEKDKEDWFRRMSER